MKRKALLLTFTAALAFGLAACSKSEPVTTTADDANKAATATAAADVADKTAEAAKVEAAKVAEAAKVEAAKTAEAAKVEAAKVAEATKVATAATAAEVVKTAEAAKATNDNKIQALIDKAKSLIAESKFSDASDVLQQLTGKSLTSEQQKIVDGLKEQIQKALAVNAAANAAGVAGDLINQ